jgi:hypothetical protein
MRSPRLLFLVVLLGLFPGLLLVTACKQPIGGRCQTNADCDEGECSTASPRTCRPVGSTGSTADAGTPDAKIDAALDQADAQPSVADAAVIDAAVTVDADTTDAPP